MPEPTHRPVLRPIGRSVLVTAALLARHRVRLPAADVGRRLRFADGTTSRVYRETVVAGAATDRPCVLVVAFRLRLVRGRGHRAFRWESLLNTPLFVGFPGFVSKLWMVHDERGAYRGVYQWNGIEQAQEYVRCLRRVLGPICAPGSVRHVLLPGADCSDLLAGRSDPGSGDLDGWWRPVATRRAGGPDDRGPGVPGLGQAEPVAWEHRRSGGRR